MSEKVLALLITGMPGVGKTTIVKKLAQDLQKQIDSVVGFYTEEVRDTSGLRIGFDVITLKGDRDFLSRSRLKHMMWKLKQLLVGLYKNKIYEKLAYNHKNPTRFHYSVAQGMRLPKVGKYSVYIEKFERLALPIVQQPANILIIDEIGKMELISKKFENEILRLIKDVENKKRCLIATIPSKSTLRTVDSLKSIRNAKIFEITKSNRNTIYETILKYSLDLVVQK